MADTKAQSSKGSDESDGKENQGAPPLEWVSAAISSFVVLAMLSFLFWEAFTRTGQPPMIAVRADSVVAAPRGFLLQIDVSNDGSETASAVQIEGTLKADATTVEQSTTTIDYLPPDGHRVAGLIFSKDPRRHRVELRVTGFDMP